MTRDPMWRRYLRFWGRNRQADVEREIDFHLAEQADRFERQGLSPEEARAAAERRFGDVERARRELVALDEGHDRSRRRFRRIGDFLHDARIGSRVLRRRPTFALAVVLTLALGIGANATLFSVVRAVLLRPLPYAAPDRLVVLWETTLGGEPNRGRVIAANYHDWRQQSQSFDRLAMFGSAGFNLTGDGDPEQVLGAAVTASYFDVLGVRPAIGRPFREEDEGPGNGQVVILGHDLWQRRYGGREDIIGQMIRFDDTPFEVVGVMPPGIYPSWPATQGYLPFLPRYQQVWVPLALTPQMKTTRRGNVFGVIGRLGDGVTRAGAQAEMDTIAASLGDEYPASNAGQGVIVSPLIDEVVGDVRPTLLILMGAVGIVLLVACANVAALILTRTVGRARELAVRSSLGASTGRLVRQLTAEVVVLAAAGAAGGLALAAGALRVVPALVPADVPRLDEVAIDPPVLGFTVAVALAVGLLCAAVPAARVSRGRTGVRLSSWASAGAASGLSDRLRSALVACQVGLAVVLTVGATLLAASYRNLGHVDPGFAPDRLLTVDLTLPAARYADAQAILTFHDALAARLRALPGVEEVATAYDLPLEAAWLDSFAIRDFAGRPEDAGGSAWLRPVSERYFSTAGISIVRGRSFVSTDDLEHPGVVVVNEAFAHRYFPGEDPVGRGLTVRSYWGWPTPTDLEIVGVVGDVRFLGVDRPAEPAWYRPVRQFPLPDLTSMIRTAGDPFASVGAVRDAIWQVDPDLPTGRVTTMSLEYAARIAQPRFMMVVQAAFGLAAALLALVGVYGLLAYQVAGRTREIGVRMALGSSAGGVVGLFVRRGLGLVAAGVLAGLAAGVLMTRVLQGVLFGVDPLDPLAFAGAAVALAGAAAVACWLPARRAARVDAMEALRAD